MKVVLSRTAARDIDRLAAFLERESPAAAIRAVETLRAAAASLRGFSERGPDLGGSGRRRLAVRFGRAAYLLDYRVSLARETVTILRVRHSREAR